MQRHWIVFDLDGTLVETEQIWRDVRRDFVIEQGGRWHESAQATMMGMRTEDWARYLHDDLGVKLPPNAIAQGVVKRVCEKISQHVPVLDGATNALSRLAGAFRLGVATSAASAVAQAVLQKTGWSKLFGTVVSADDVACGKPAADVYLRALELLEADAARTAAVEDSENGIRSAKAAQLAVIAIPNREFAPQPDVLGQAARVLNSLHELDVPTVRSVLQARE